MESKIVDPLESLFVKEGEIDRELLKNILLPYVRLDEKGHIFPLTSFYATSNKNKLILLLLARKVIALKINTREEITPLELAVLGNIPAGSVRPTLRSLVEEGIVDDENGTYKVFSHALQKCASLFSLKEGSELRAYHPRISMSQVLNDLIQQGAFDESKTAREIHDLVLQRRPGTSYKSLYKVILDLVSQQLITREIKGSMWAYKRGTK